MQFEIGVANFHCYYWRCLRRTFGKNESYSKGFNQLKFRLHTAIELLLNIYYLSKII